ncbi:MAG: hypothetical protein WC600_08540 [Desulfobaccales bacterium]
MGIVWQGIYHSADGQTRRRAHRGPSHGPAPAAATAVIAPTATTTGDADITGIRHIHVFVIGVSSTISVVLPPVIVPAMVTMVTMVTAPGTAAVVTTAMVVPKAAAAEAAIMAPAAMIATKAPAAAMKAAATPTPGLGFLGKQGRAEN